jgi:hypothetical protein
MTPSIILSYPMKQTNFSDAEFSSKKKLTRRKRFLAENENPDQIFESETEGTCDASHKGKQLVPRDAPYWPDARLRGFIVNENETAKDVEPATKMEEGELRLQEGVKPPKKNLVPPAGKEITAPTTRELAFSVISILLLALLFPLSEVIRSGGFDQLYRAVCGVILGTYGVVGYALAVYLWKAFRAGRLLDAVDTNRWTRPFSFVMILLLLALGVTTWFVGWEGHNTGKYYGLGVLIGGAIAEAGIGSLLKRGRS